MRIWDTIDKAWKDGPTYSEHRQEQRKAIIRERIELIEGRFYSWHLHLQQEEDFAWLVKTLKQELKNGS